MSANELAALVNDLAAAFFLLGMVSVFCALLFYSLMRRLVFVLLDTGPIRRLRYDFWVKAHDAKLARMAARLTGGAYSAPLRARRHIGRSSLPLLFVLSAALVGLLSACSAPGAHYSDSHGVWVERMKQAGW